MRYRIDQDELWEFLARPARLVERLPVEVTRAAGGWLQRRTRRLGR